MVNVNVNVANPVAPLSSKIDVIVVQQPPVQRR